MESDESFFCGVPFLSGEGDEELQDRTDTLMTESDEFLRKRWLKKYKLLAEKRERLVTFAFWRGPN